MYFSTLLTTYPPPKWKRDLWRLVNDSVSEMICNSIFLAFHNLFFHTLFKSTHPSDFCKSNIYLMIIMLLATYSGHTKFNPNSKNVQKYKTCSCPLVWYFGTLFWDDTYYQILGWKSIMVFNWERKICFGPILTRFVYLIFIGQKRSYFHHYVDS